MFTLTTEQIARRYNVSKRTLRRRRLADPTFPQPLEALSRKTHHLYDAAQVHAWYESYLRRTNQS